jgi:proteasome lid subunit RPN8/RPN11
MNRLIRIREAILAEMSGHARRTPRKECCGLLAGNDGVITRAFPATNAASKSGTSYEIAPEELFRLMRAIRSEGLQLLGIYHSHPNGASEPSARDVAQAFYPDAAYFIVSPQAVSSNVEKPEAVRAFSIRGGKVEELPLEVL